MGCQRFSPQARAASSLTLQDLQQRSGDQDRELAGVPVLSKNSHYCFQAILPWRKVRPSAHVSTTPVMSAGHGLVGEHCLMDCRRSSLLRESLSTQKNPTGTWHVTRLATTWIEHPVTVTHLPTISFPSTRKSIASIVFGSEATPTGGETRSVDFVDGATSEGSAEPSPGFGGGR